jgi:hypothetical protein
MASRRLLEPQASIRELLLVIHHSVVEVIHHLVIRHRAIHHLVIHHRLSDLHHRLSDHHRALN